MLPSERQSAECAAARGIEPVVRCNSAKRNSGKTIEETQKRSQMTKKRASATAARVVRAMPDHNGKRSFCRSVVVL